MSGPDLIDTGVSAGPAEGVEHRQALIIGAGPAGLAVAAQLRHHGIDALVIERTGVIASSWRTRYDGLRLNTDRWMARLPGAVAPRERWPSRDGFLAYLEAYRERHQIEVRFGSQVELVERRDQEWSLHTGTGKLSAPFLIVATGRDQLPELPRWPGAEKFAGRLLHAAEYRSSTPFRGKDVLIVGMGNSGTEISAQLARGGAGRVRVSMRTPPNLVPANLLGVPITLWARLTERVPAAIMDPVGRLIQRTQIGDLSAYGLPRAPMGLATELERKGLGPVVDRGFTAALRAGQIELVAALEGFSEREVRLADSTCIQPEVVIAATGYSFGLEPLVGELGVLTPTGEPAVRDGQVLPAAPGLFFNGYWLPQTGELPAMRRNARRIARQIASQMRAARASG